MRLNEGFPSGSVVKSVPVSAGSAGFTPGSGRSPGKEVLILSTREIPWTEEPGGPQFMGLQELDKTWQLYNSSSMILNEGAPWWSSG